MLDVATATLAVQARAARKAQSTELP